EPELTTSGIDPDDPERARPPLLLLAPPVGERAGAQDGLRRRAIELPPAAEVPLGLLEDFLPALAGLGPALGPWHVGGLLCCTVLASEARLEIGNEHVQARLVDLRDHRRLAELALALGRLALQLVALPSAPALELSGCGALEPLRGRTLRLHLGHFGTPLLDWSSGERSTAPWARGSC